jgi:hypothetical protein
MTAVAMEIIIGTLSTSRVQSRANEKTAPIIGFPSALRAPE